MKNVFCEYMSFISYLVYKFWNLLLYMDIRLIYVTKTLFEMTLYLTTVFSFEVLFQHVLVTIHNLDFC